MSPGRVAALCCALGAAFVAGWLVRGNSGEPTRLESPSIDSTALAEVRAERDRLRTELARVRRARDRTTGAERSDPEPRVATEPNDDTYDEPPAEGGVPAAPSRGPHRPLIEVAGFENAASWADWWLVGALVRHRRAVSAARVRIVAEGGDPDDVEDGGWATDWMDDGSEQLLRALPSQLGDSPEAAGTHPVATVNVMAAVLEQSALPLSHDQTLRLAEVGRRWGERESRMAARDAKSEEMSFMRRLVRRTERRDEFLAEAFSILSAAQSAALRPPPEQRLVGNDYFSAAPVLAPHGDAYWGPPNGDWSLGEHALRADGPGLRGESEAVRARVLDLTRQWERTVPREHWPYHPSGDVDQYRVDFLLGVTKALARLHDSWLNDAGLGVGARSNLREPQDIFMVQSERPAAR